MTEQPAGLPHRYPFVLLDRLVEVRRGVSAVAVKSLTRDDPALDGNGWLPAVLLAEALAQCAGLAMQPGGAVLVRIDRFRVRRGPVGAGDQLRVSVRIVRTFGATIKTRGVVRCNGRICAAGEVVLQMANDAVARSDGAV